MTRYRFDEIAFNSTEKKKPVEADKEHYIGLEHLDSDSLEVRRWGSDVAPTGEKLLMKKGDVLFGKRRAYQKKVAIAPFDGIFSAHGMVLRPKEEVITKEYFPFFIKSDYFLDAAIKISVGSLSPTINWKDLQKLEFDLPPLEEQKRLADILWAAEELKQKYQMGIRATEKLIIAEFTRLFGDVNHEFIYPLVPLDQIVDIRDDLREPLNDEIRKSMKTGEILYPYFGATGCVDYINQYKIDASLLCIAEDCGEYGANTQCSYIVNGKCWVNNHAHVLIPKENICNLTYLQMYLTIKDLKEFISGGTRSKLTKKDLYKIQIMLPPYELQLAFEELSEKIDSQIKNLDCTKNKMMILYSSILIGA